MEDCDHIKKLDKTKLYRQADFAKFECEECVKTNSKWVHLRICQTCGKMLCCDSSPNQHSRKHFHETKHPIITSGEMGETWIYCYMDDVTSY